MRIILGLRVTEKLNNSNLTKTEAYLSLRSELIWRLCSVKPSETPLLLVFPPNGFVMSPRTSLLASVQEVIQNGTPEGWDWGRAGSVFPLITGPPAPVTGYE